VQHATRTWHVSSMLTRAHIVYRVEVEEAARQSLTHEKSTIGTVTRGESLTWIRAAVRVARAAAGRRVQRANATSHRPHEAEPDVHARQSPTRGLGGHCIRPVLRQSRRESTCEARDARGFGLTCMEISRGARVACVVRSATERESSAGVVRMAAHSCKVENEDGH
jgi:hypothetical protein